MKTADLIDEHAKDLRLVHLPFRRFGRTPHFAAPVQTVKCFEDNTVVRAQLETHGDGRVLVVDGGGSTRIAILGDMLADLAIKNGWAGLVLNATIRDSAEIDEMNTLVFALGAALAGFAGALIGAIRSVQVGMGEPVLILAFVVIVIGGIGSIKGALVGAILVGLTDTLGRLLLPQFFGLFMEPSAATSVGSSLSSMSIYILMAGVLLFKPSGLFGGGH